MRLPALGEMLLLLRRESGVVQDEPSPSAFGLELEPGNRIDAFGPVDDAPSLDDSLLGDQLDVASYDMAAEAGEGTARPGVDLGRETPRQGAELFGGQERVVDAAWARSQLDFLMDRRPGLSA